MPTSAEVPELIIDHVEHPAANPLGVRGVGEGGTLGPNAVLAGAVSDALGIRIDTCRSPGHRVEGTAMTSEADRDPRPPPANSGPTARGPSAPSRRRWYR